MASITLELIINKQGSWAIAQVNIDRGFQFREMLWNIGSELNLR